MAKGPAPKAARLVPAANLGAWLRALTADNRVLAPVTVEGRPLFREIAAGEEANLNLQASHAVNSPKGALLPQTEALMTYSQSTGPDGRSTMTVEPVPTGGPAVVFGARPCDAAAMELFDKVFLTGDFVDDQYRQRREKTTVVTVACPSPAKSCFCTSFGLSPGGAKGADVVLYGRSGPGPAVEPDAYYAVAYTDRGEAFLASAAAKAAGLVELGTREEGERLEKVVAAYQASKTPLGEKLGRVDVAAKLDGLFESPYWEKAAARCIACGTCTFVCPTCYCFGVADGANRGAGAGEAGGVRFRYWDSCKFPQFLLMAGGHNPRPAKKHRTRQRFMHKLNYFPRRYGGDYLCVGCGRCVETCPVGLHLPLVVRDVRGL